MADYEATQEVIIKLPSLIKTIELTAGEKLTKDADVVAWANKTVPAGKRATRCECRY